MHLNLNTAISTCNILLVPYEAYHVETYHDWMKDKDIQEATASEPLSLEEEYAMQKSWRNDPDKLTFIVCLPVTRPSDNAKSSEAIAVSAAGDDAPNRMLGDVNLFLTSADEDPEGCMGEIEIMIAATSMRRKGYGRATVLAFLLYIRNHLSEMLAQYASAMGQEKMRLLQLRVKIGSKNEKSINLFKSIGFILVGAGENYFGEIEMTLEGFLDCPIDEAGYQELPYER